MCENGGGVKKRESGKNGMTKSTEEIERKRRQVDGDGEVRDWLDRIEARLEKIEGLLMGLLDLTDAVRAAVISWSILGYGG